MQTKIWKRNLFLVLLLAVGLCVSIPVRFLYNRNKTLLLTQTQEKALNIASTVAAFLSYDIERYRPISEAESLTTASKLEQDYQKLNAGPARVKSKMHATSLPSNIWMTNQRIVLD
jgi:cell division protein YceG involved in septum cleavage